MCECVSVSVRESDCESECERMSVNFSVSECE